MAKKSRKASTLERSFLSHWELIGDRSLPPEREFMFALPERRWRFDLAWPSRMVAIELEGGTWVKGRHNTGAGIAEDCVKYNWALEHGWRVLRFTTDQIRKAPVQCIEQVQRMLATEPRYAEPVQQIQTRLL
jgi:very-short-patch-repair endonuclease